MKGDKMTPYIVNLTNSLIGKHRFNDLFFNRHRSFDYKTKFIEMVAYDLEMNDVRQMNPETLGRVLCSLETGDVLTGKKEILGGLHFSGDPGETLREMVAVCLAYVIRDRLDPDMADSGIPRYKSSRPLKRTALVSAIGERHHSETAQESDRFWCSGCNGDSRTCNCE